MGRFVTVALVVCLLLAGCIQSASPTPERQTLAGEYRVTVTTVVDGDTVRVRFANGTTDTVRLLGVDTPETQSENDPGEFEGVPDTAAGRDCLRALGHDATRLATRTLLGEEVRLRLDPQSDGRGYYGRLLAYVVVDESSFNHRLVADGYARVYDSEFSESDRFYAAESRAQDNATGVWTCRRPESADTGTATPEGTATATGDASVVVASTHADAEGRDGENLNDEYIVFRNRGNETLDLSGWTVADAVDHTYQFPDGATLPAGDTVTLHTGSGEDTTADRYWDRGSPVWNNDGDTVVVRDASGQVVGREAY